MQEVHRRGWKLSIPDGWAVQSSESEVIFVPPDSGPVLTIGTSTLNGALSNDDLRHFARDLVEDGHQPISVKLGDFEGICFRYVEEDCYWRHWYLRADSMWLQINYDCALSERGKHDAAIDNILGSLTLDASAI